MDGYLAAHPTLPAALFNESGRAFPDVSMAGLASGLGALRIARSTGAELAGVAAAAPAGFGALVSLLNDIRLQRGQPPLGFLNPALYRLSRHAFGPSHLRSFVDVVSERLRSSRATEQATERRAASHPRSPLTPLPLSAALPRPAPRRTPQVAGENRCSSDPAHCCVGGFPAAAGWDAATGLGTPNFTSIAEVLAAEPCFGVDCGGGVCNQGRCMCKNGHGYDEGGRCVPLKPFPKKLVEEVAALAVAGVWLLVQVCAFLNNCCCAKKGKDDKRGCFARCCACVCRVLCGAREGRRRRRQQRWWCA